MLTLFFEWWNTIEKKGDIMRVEMVTIKKETSCELEVFFNGDHHLKIGDAMRVEIGIFNGDRHFEKTDTMRVDIVF